MKSFPNFKAHSVILALLLLIGSMLIVGCAAQTTQTSSPTPTPEPYWEPGSQYANLPVADMWGHRSKRLHDEFAACGLTDQDAYDAVNFYEQHQPSDGSPLTTTRYPINANGSTGKGIDITVQAVGAGIYEATCANHVGSPTP